MACSFSRSRDVRRRKRDMVTLLLTADSRSYSVPWWLCSCTAQVKVGLLAQMNPPGSSFPQLRNANQNHGDTAAAGSRQQNVPGLSPYYT